MQLSPHAFTLRQLQYAVGVIPTISPYLLPEVVPALRRRFPKLTLHWVEEKTATLVSLMQAGDLDAAVLALEADLGDLARSASAA